MTSEPGPGLTAAALAVLTDEFGLQVARLSHLATHSNVLFRADLSDGRRLVLRVGEPFSNTRSNIDIEVAWLAALAEDPRLLIATPLPTPDGRFVVEIPSKQGARSCVLFKWVPGEPIGEGSGTGGYRAMGRLSALLHSHGAWRPDDPGSLRRWDRTFYYPAEIDPIVIDSFRYDHLFQGRRSMLQRAAERADAYIKRRWEAGSPMVVHGDLHEYNVHMYMGRAWAIDFEDVMLALPSQDIATSLYAARARPDIASLIDAFRSGYEEHREWPVRHREELEAYWSARQVMLMNHAAQILSEREATEYFEEVYPWLKSYLARTD